MSRDICLTAPPSPARCTLVWLTTSLTAAAAWWFAVPAALPLLNPEGWVDPFDALIVRVCALVLLPATVWAWTVTTWAVTDLFRGRQPADGGTTRRLILLACGVAVAVGTLSPAGATPGPGPDRLAGLAMPDRAVGTVSAAQPGPTPRTTTAHVVVQTGDTLWSIARASQRPGEQWREIWAANRDVIGPDPNLIIPGQRLDLPTSSNPPTQPGSIQ